MNTQTNTTPNTGMVATFRTQFGYKGSFAAMVADLGIWGGNLPPMSKGDKNKAIKWAAENAVTAPKGQKFSWASVPQRDRRHSWVWAASLRLNVTTANGQLNAKEVFKVIDTSTSGIMVVPTEFGCQTFGTHAQDASWVHSVKAQISGRLDLVGSDQIRSMIEAVGAELNGIRLTSGCWYFGPKALSRAASFIAAVEKGATAVFQLSVTLSGANAGSIASAASANWRTEIDRTLVEVEGALANEATANGNRTDPTSKAGGYQRTSLGKKGAELGKLLDKLAELEGDLGVRLTNTRETAHKLKGLCQAMAASQKGNGAALSRFKAEHAAIAAVTGCVLAASTLATTSTPIKGKKVIAVGEAESAPQSSGSTVAAAAVDALTHDAQNEDDAFAF